MKTCILLFITGFFLSVSSYAGADIENKFPEESSIKLPETPSLDPEKRGKLFAFLGKIYEEQGDFHRAAVAYQQSLKISPDDLKLRASLARVYREAGEEDTAEREYGIILASCARDLTNPNPSVRLEAIKIISPIPGPESDSLLLKALADPNAFVRQAGARALGKRGNEDAIPMLLQLVENRKTAMKSISILSQMRVSEAVPAIAKHLSDSNLGYRRTAASCLGSMGDPSALDYLLPGLKDENYQMRKTTAYALWQIHDTRAVPPLIAALDDDAAIVKKLAAYSLGKLGDPEAIEPLEKLLEDTTDSNHLYAALALAELGVSVDTKIFLDELDAEDFFYRGTAIEGLKASGDPAAALAIIPMLKDRTSWVRTIAAESLATLNIPESLEALIETNDFPEKAYAAAALWNLGDNSGPELLSELMESPYPENREFAARALKYVNDEARLPLLEKALNDPSLIVRRIAEESLQAKEEIIE